MSGSDIETYRGDDLKLVVSFAQEDGTVYDLTGATLFLTIKKSISDTDAEAIYRDTITSFDDPTSGSQDIVIPNTTTDNFVITSYVYDIQLKESDGSIKTVIKGKILVDLDVTRRTE